MSTLPSENMNTIAVRSKNNILFVMDLVKIQCASINSHSQISETKCPTFGSSEYQSPQRICIKVIEFGDGAVLQVQLRNSAEGRR